MFKNIIMYRIAPDWRSTASEVEARLQDTRFVECGASQEKSLGWIEPRGEDHGPLLEVVAGQWILKLMVETRALPASVVNRKAQERVAQIEAATGRKPGKKETRDLKDDIRLELLPMAFTKQSSTLVWIDREASLLVLDAGSQARADELVTLLVQSLPGLALTLVNTKVSPSAAMAEWLVSMEAPQGFSVDRECELKAADESKAVVRYARHRLDTDEVKQHIEGGKMPTRLALTWNDRVSFVLTEGLQLKKLAFLDVVFEGASSGKDDGFDADVAISTGELQQALPVLLEALGGELPLA
ncbi:MAG: recombination-associated protein RdgC [Rhodoferax sp.]|nr:recombination-associated protein RdgC [Betaproteobacteria bacterium]NCN96330.1 recombination-associated protein RdgC [Rhodoferax sp.]PIZ21436.1 MAG: recombination-associated protein RdgC [Comamonadaceae bacterium CG_4_10_14_0_8_um_filter_57_29]PJC19934.1 MAG: recombination-associated protein RdgC [Comamonadaceae bacterium CG_4_9_14_0_8_um_filter_57_21]NCP81161.1 recombination-associated protein RdgC [Rhodoferax sp.]